MRLRKCTAGILLLALGAAAEPRVECLPQYSLLELSLQARLIVIAEPENPRDLEEGKESSRFKIVEILKGSGPKPGEGVTVRGMDLYRMTGLLDDPDRKPPGPIERALIFLEPAPEEEKQSRPVPSGIRLLTRGSEVFRPEQPMNPGPYVFTPGKEQDWLKVIDRVKQSLARIAPILELRKIEDPAKRNEAVLKWIEGNRKEFGFKRSDPDGVQEGLGSLGWTMFEWVMGTCIPSDCWRASTLYGEFYSSSPQTDPRRPPFGSVEGRDLLASIAFDERRPDDDRLRALEYLAMSCTLWPYPDPALPRIARVDRQEADALIQKARPLLRAKTERMREQAVRVVFHASHPRDGGLIPMETKSALPDLVEAYRAEPPGVVRDALAEAIRWIGGAAHWNILTGNTKGTLITLYSFGRSGDEVTFWLNRVLCSGPVTECPTLVLSLLDEAGKPVSVQEKPLPATYLPQPWEKGWGTGSGNIEVRFSTRGLAAGTWDVWVKGAMGLDKSPWHSEPKRFRSP